MITIRPDSLEMSSRARARNRKGTGSPSFHVAADLGLKSGPFFLSSRERSLDLSLSGEARVLGFLEGLGFSGGSGLGSEALGLGLGLAVGELDFFWAARRALPMRTSATVRPEDIAGEGRRRRNEKDRRFFEQTLRKKTEWRPAGILERSMQL